MQEIGPSREARPFVVLAQADRLAHRERWVSADVVPGDDQIAVVDDFKGTKAGDLPVQRADKFTLIINRKTAKAHDSASAGASYNVFTARTP
jgi:hypothetical protein